MNVSAQITSALKNKVSAQIIKCSALNNNIPISISFHTAYNFSKNMQTINHSQSFIHSVVTSLNENWNQVFYGATVWIMYVQ